MKFGIINTFIRLSNFHLFLHLYIQIPIHQSNITLALCQSAEPPYGYDMVLDLPK